MISLWAAAVLMTLTAIVHSMLGEKRLIGPLLKLDSEVTNRPLARKVLRFAWHFTSILMVLSALLVIWPGTPVELVQVTGATWLAVGIFDAIYSQGKHVGWPFLALAGLLALVGTIA